MINNLEKSMFIVSIKPTKTTQFACKKKKKKKEVKC